MDFIDNLRVCHSAFIVIWIAHVCACVWYLIGTVDTHIELPGGGVYRVNGWVTALRESYTSGSNRTSDRVFEYLQAFHAVNPKMYDLVDHVEGEFTKSMLVGAIVLETLGLIVFGAVLGKLTNFLSAGQQAEQAYRTKMDELRDFFKQKNLPAELRLNVRKFYDNLYQKKTVFDEQAILRPLPPQLAKEMVDALYADLIASSKMFAGVRLFFVHTMLPACYYVRLALV